MLEEAMMRMAEACDNLMLLREPTRQVAILCTRTGCERCEEWKSQNADLSLLLRATVYDWVCDNEARASMARRNGVGRIPAVILLPRLDDVKASACVVDPFSLLSSG